MREKRQILVHCHIFKNAGSSIDHMLKESFGKQWTSWDTENPSYHIPADEVEKFLLDHPEVRSLSSHQICPPISVACCDLYPIVFLRHPVDRAYSTYMFEWIMSKGHEKPAETFEEYAQRTLQSPVESIITNLQARHLIPSDSLAQWEAGTLNDEGLFHQARATLQILPFFGVVDNFESSMIWMKRTLGHVFPELSYKIFEENVLRDCKMPLKEKIATIQAQCSPVIYKKLLVHNQADLALYEFGSNTLMTRTIQA